VSEDCHNSDNMPRPGWYKGSYGGEIKGLSPEQAKTFWGNFEKIMERPPDSLQKLRETVDGLRGIRWGNPDTPDIQNPRTLRKFSPDKSPEEYEKFSEADINWLREEMRIGV
jgi:hypothetical protein